MIFARYKGASKELTEGKVYVARPEMDEKSMVGFGFLNATDDAGKPIRIDPNSEQWEFLSEVYAVVVRPFEGFVGGEVVVVDDADINGSCLYNIKGLGYRSASGLILLDRTNVFPGMMVMEKTTGCWKKIRTVDEGLGVSVDGSDGRRSPDDFRFAVADGDVLMEPVVTCVDTTGLADLTEGRYYVLTKTDPDGRYVMLADDSGSVGEFMPERFKMGMGK